MNVQRVAIAITASILVACGGPEVPLRIEFEVHAHGRPIDCESETASGQLSDLRLYLYDLEVIGSDGSATALRLEPDQRWQSQHVAMLDFENGQGACLNGTVATNKAIIGTWSGGDSRGLRFKIGVPEALNHDNPLLAEPPLGDSAMHWHWASGYKFIRAGGQGPDGEFVFHLGSNRCAGTIGDIRGCRGENRPEVLLEEFDPGSQRVIIDIGEWLKVRNVIDRCMSAPDNADCKRYFDSVGVDFTTGQSVSPVHLFGVADR